VRSENIHNFQLKELLVLQTVLPINRTNAGERKPNLLRTAHMFFKANRTRTVKQTTKSNDKNLIMVAAKSADFILSHLKEAELNLLRIVPANSVQFRANKIFNWHRRKCSRSSCLRLFLSKE
jgi:hypothetical protein